MKLLESFIKEVRDSNNIEAFFEKTIRFFETNYNSLVVNLYDISPFYPYLKPHFDLKGKQEIFKSVDIINQNIKKNKFIIQNEFYLFPLGNEKEPDSLLVFKDLNKDSQKEIQQLCTIFNDVYLFNSCS